MCGLIILLFCPDWYDVYVFIPIVLFIIKNGYTSECGFLFLFEIWVSIY